MVVWAKRGLGWTYGALMAGLLTTLVSVQLVHAVPASPVLQAPIVAGPQVTLTWSGVPGALGYRLAIGIAPGTEAYAQVVGPVTSVSFTSPFVGTGYVRVQAFDATGLSAASNEVVLTVTTLTPPPAAPINLQAFVSGYSVTLGWAAGAGGGPPLGVILEAGTAPGAANLGALPLPLSTQVTVPDVKIHAGTSYAWDVNGYGQRITWTGGVNYTIDNYMTGAVVTTNNHPLAQPEIP